MVKGKTTTGFSYEVNEKALHDAEFLELFAKVQNGDNLLVFEMIRKVLGDEQKQKLFDHCRIKDGMVPVEAVSSETAEIFQ